MDLVFAFPFDLISNFPHFFEKYVIIVRFEVGWKTADFKMGDVLIFTSRLVHMSTKNISNKLRISCDTRYDSIQFV